LVGGPGELADVVSELAKAHLAFAQRLVVGSEHRFSALALGYFLCDHVDPNNTSIGTLQRVPVCNPDVVGVEFVRSLPAHLDARDWLSSAHDSFNNFFDLICNLWNSFANRLPDVVGDGKAANLRQSSVDLNVAAIGR